MSGSDCPKLAFKILIEESNEDGAPAARLFENAETILSAGDPETAQAHLKTIDAWVQDGGWAAGLFAYSLGAALEPRLTPLLASGGDRTPLMTVGLFGPPTWLDGPARAAFLGA
ncbi:MAG: hypothetical protein AAGH45_01435, partial [Pseudomonadota bacterium]